MFLVKMTNRTSLVLVLIMVVQGRNGLMNFSDFKSMDIFGGSSMKRKIPSSMFRREKPADDKADNNYHKIFEGFGAALTTEAKEKKQGTVDGPSGIKFRRNEDTGGSKNGLEGLKKRLDSHLSKILESEETDLKDKYHDYKRKEGDNSKNKGKSVVDQKLELVYKLKTKIEKRAKQFCEVNKDMINVLPKFKKLTKSGKSCIEYFSLKWLNKVFEKMHKGKKNQNKIPKNPRKKNKEEDTRVENEDEKKRNLLIEAIRQMN